MACWSMAGDRSSVIPNKAGLPCRHVPVQSLALQLTFFTFGGDSRRGGGALALSIAGRRCRHHASSANTAVATSVFVILKRLADH